MEGLQGRRECGQGLVGKHLSHGEGGRGNKRLTTIDSAVKDYE